MDPVSRLRLHSLVKTPVFVDYLGQVADGVEPMQDLTLAGLVPCRVDVEYGIVSVYDVVTGHVIEARVSRFTVHLRDLDTYVGVTERLPDFREVYNTVKKEARIACIRA